MDKFIVVTLLALLTAGCAMPHYQSEVGKEMPSVEQGIVASTAAPSLSDAKRVYDEGKYTEALLMYRSLAEQGDVNARNRLAFMYIGGKGVPEDAAEGARHLLLAAEQGDPQSQNDLGMMYFYGKGMKKNYVLAYMWLEISAANSYKTENKRFTQSSSITKHLSFEQFNEAKALVKKCTANQFKGCEKL